MRFIVPPSILKLEIRLPIGNGFDHSINPYPPKVVSGAREDHPVVPVTSSELLCSARLAARTNGVNQNARLDVFANVARAFVNQNFVMARFQERRKERRERPFIPGVGGEMASRGENRARGAIGDRTKRS